MTYEIYHWIFIGGAILAGLMLALTVLLFFRYRIPRVIGDLTGSTARKAIEDIRQQNTQSGTKVYKSSTVNRERGKVTAKMTSTGKLARQNTDGAGAMRTDKLNTQKLAEQAASSSDETVLLDATAAETTVLAASVEETTVLKPAAETTVLYEPANGMPVPPVGSAPSGAPTCSGPFVIEYELTYVHSDERIA